MSRAMPGATPRLAADVERRAAVSPRPNRPSLLRHLVGSGDRIALTVLPFALLGLALNFTRPEFFHVGGPPRALALVSVFVLSAGIVNWAWSVELILTKVPRGELITTGPYAIVKHPLYTGVALLVLPWLGFVLDSWLGAALGLVLYAASRRFSASEERELSATFGNRWDDYSRNVWLPRL